MRKYLFAFGFALLALSSGAQTLDRCATMPHLAEKINQNPELQQRMEASEARAAEWRAQHPQFKTTGGGGVLTIPVVVHVLYKNAQQNITDAQIFSQLDVLNADYRKLNADTANRRSMFDTLATDMEIEFCLASVDPNGNATTGINRVSTSGGSLLGYFNPLTDDAKSAASGGADPWPSDQYLNIWVCDLFPIVLGYAQFPGEDPTTDGVVIGFNYFGTLGTVTAPYNGGRTTSHEVGHWLGLRHIWGDDDCPVDDFVDDTPRSDAANQGGCLLTENSCVDSIYDYPDMVENYMDYSDDGCMNMLTHGQKARVWSFLNTDRAGLFNSQGCNTTVAISDPSLDHEVQLYPNPSQGTVYLDWRAGSQPIQSLRVTDVTGRTVLEMGEGQPRAVDLNGQPGGMYFFHFVRGDKNIVRSVVIR